MSASVSMSTAAVASSRNKIFDLRRRALNKEKAFEMTINSNGYGASNGVCACVRMYRTFECGRAHIA